MRKRLKGRDRNIRRWLGWQDGERTEAAMRSGKAAYVEALRTYCRPARDEALRLRRGVA